MARNVLILQAADSTVELARLLVAEQWQSRRAPHPDQIATTVNGWNCQVGIGVFDDSLQYSPNDFADIIGDSPSVLVAVSDLDTAEPLLAGLPGVRSVDRQDGALVVDLDGTPRREMIDALVSAGVGVDRVVPRRRLEDAFLALLDRED